MPNAHRYKLIKIVMPTRSELERGSGSYTPKRMKELERLGIEILPPLKEQDTDLERMIRYCCASICLSTLKIMLALYTSHNIHLETALEADDHSHATIQRTTTEAYIFLSILEILVALYALYRREGRAFYATTCPATLQIMVLLHALYKAQDFTSILRAL
jgi:hypothetical protein